MGGKSQNCCILPEVKYRLTITLSILCWDIRLQLRRPSLTFIQALEHHILPKLGPFLCLLVKLATAFCNFLSFYFVGVEHVDTVSRSSIAVRYRNSTLSRGLVWVQPNIVFFVIENVSHISAQSAIQNPVFESSDFSFLCEDSAVSQPTVSMALAQLYFHK